MKTEHPDIGSLLKTRRQECGLTVDDVANRTRIRRTYLLALEENRFQDLPGEAYIHGFLRNYARALGLQQAAVLDVYRAQRGEGVSFEEAKAVVDKKVAPLPPSKKKKSWGLLPWLGIAVLVIGAFSLIALQSFLSRPEPLPPREPIAVIDTNPPPPPAPPTAESAGEPGAPAPVDGSAAPGTDAAVPSAVPALPGVPAIPGVNAPAPAGTAASPGMVAKPLLPGEGKGVDQAIAPAPKEATQPSGEEPPVFEFSGSGLVRLESSGANQIEFAGDNRLPQNYELTASAVLNWKVRQNARITFADPAAVKIWVDQRPLSLGGRSTIVLQRKAVPPAATE